MGHLEPLTDKPTELGLRVYLLLPVRLRPRLPWLQPSLCPPPHPDPSPPCPHLSTSAFWLGLVTAAMYCMMCLLASVFPAPLSPAVQMTVRQN